MFQKDSAVKSHCEYLNRAKFSNYQNILQNIIIELILYNLHNIF